MTFFFSGLCALIIITLSLVSPGNLPKETHFLFHGFDKIVHGLMYFGLTTIFTFELELSQSSHPNKRLITKRATGFVELWKSLDHSIKQPILAGLIASIFGVVMELSQMWFTHDRSFDIYDIIANINGCILSMASYIILSTSKRK